MDLFKIENKQVKITPEALLFSEFSEIWERDTSEKKEKAMELFAYITFLCSWKSTNPFTGYSDEERPKKISLHLFDDEDYDPREGDPLLIDAIDKFKDLQYNASFSLKYFEAARLGAEKVLDYFNNLDLAETNDRGFLIHKAADVTKAIKDTRTTLKELNELEKNVRQELFEAAKTRNQREVNVFER